MAGAQRRRRFKEAAQILRHARAPGGSTLDIRCTLLLAKASLSSVLLFPSSLEVTHALLRTCCRELASHWAPRPHDASALNSRLVPHPTWVSTTRIYAVYGTAFAGLSCPTVPSAFCMSSSIARPCQCLWDFCCRRASGPGPGGFRRACPHARTHARTQALYPTCTPVLRLSSTHCAHPTTAACILPNLHEGPGR